MTLFGDYRSKNFCRLDVLIDIQPFSITLSDNQGNQELLVVKDKVGRPPGEFGVSKSMGCDIFPSVFWHCWLGDRKGIRPVKKLDRWFVGDDDLTGALHDF